MPDQPLSQSFNTFPAALTADGNAAAREAECTGLPKPVTLRIGKLRIAKLNIHGCDCCGDGSSGGGLPTEPEEPGNPGGEAACECIVREDPSDPD